MASAPINPTQITPPRVAFIDDRTGAISREWFRFFLSLQDSAQTSQEAATLTPSTESLVASYAAMLDTLAQETESQPSSASADDVAVLQTQIVDLEVEPPCATLDDAASLQTQIVDLELEPPCASVEDVALLQTQAQDLAESVLPDPQTFLLPVWSAIQDLALAPSVIVSVAAASSGGVSILNDNATAGPAYPLFYTGTGSTSTLYQSDGGLAYYPSTGAVRTTLARHPASATGELAQTSGDVTFGGRIYANRTMPAMREATGTGYALAPHPAHRKIAQAQFGAGTTVTTIVAASGLFPYTAVSPGTPTIVTPTTTVPFQRTGIVTAGTAGSIASFRGSAAPTVAGVPFFWSFRFGTSAVFGSLAFVYVGLVDVSTVPTSADPTAAGSTTPGRLGVGMNNASGGALRIINNVTGTAPTTTALTGGAYTNMAGFFELTLWSDGTNYYWQIAVASGGGFTIAVNSGTFSANRPASGTTLYPVAWISNNGAGSAETLQLISITRETES